MTNKHALLLKDTIWAVPPATLLAYEYSRFAHTPVMDQTVWVIDEYNAGYFFGKSYTEILHPPERISRSENKLIGSITEEGNVHITFVPVDPENNDDFLETTGIFSKEHGSYQFIMQMNGRQNKKGLCHWSYMVHITEESPYFHSLPGTHQSLPQFLAGFK